VDREGNVDLSMGREPIGYHVVDVLGHRLGRIDDVLLQAIVVRSGFRGQRVSLLTSDRLTEVNSTLRIVIDGAAFPHTLR
jgi:hypothetical protein